ncbi:hypothetical protein CVT25_010970 [Psilocybe cyanescens]|uniref:N-end rule aminoacyl transferase C-terminal domain-containing protein n=1 Tax=Psilocybe cyanescens TaxID=93625 RepID=A0A409WFR6_PSICY|nr:hypothetical protein CVT25_010970 [Psilocybe cyanescens]
MENPHAERQAVLLERIVKNTISTTSSLRQLQEAPVVDIAVLQGNGARKIQIIIQPRLSHINYRAHWNRFILYGESDGDMIMEPSVSVFTPPVTKSRVKPTKSSPFTSLAAAIHESEVTFTLEERPAHKFEVVLEPASYTPEKFALYIKYQMGIHQDHKNTESGFKRFLVESPLNTELIPYSSSPPQHLPPNYGSYHQLYRLDGELIAVGVLDILPNCVSSVYFMYDNAWERFSLGKLSALREVSLAREIKEAGAPDMQSLYMGFYIYSCQKMRYKGEYAPSCLADPETYEWFPLEACTPLLEKNRYACFSQPSHSTNDEASVDEPEPVLLSTDAEEFDSIKILCRARNGDIIAVPIKDTTYLSYQQVREELGSCIQELGHTLATQIYFTP